MYMMRTFFSRSKVSGSSCACASLTGAMRSITASTASFFCSLSVSLGDDHVGLHPVPSDGYGRTIDGHDGYGSTVHRP